MSSRSGADEAVIVNTMGHEPVDCTIHPVRYHQAVHEDAASGTIAAASK